jgi:hypothetical protein
MIEISHNKINNIFIIFLNKTNGQTRSLKVKNDIFNRTEGVHIWMFYIWVSPELCTSLTYATLGGNFISI